MTDVRGRLRSGPVPAIKTLVERPDLADAPMGTDADVPAFVGHDPAGRFVGYWGIAERFPEFSLVAVDPDGAVVGKGGGVPFTGRGTLPDRGWDELLAWALDDVRRGAPPDSLGLLGIAVRPDQRGTGLAARMLRALKEAARAADLAEVVAPVRPTMKDREPDVPMREYARRTRPDGLPADPWLRTHARAGGTIVSVAPASMVVAGSLAEWRAWTGLPFDADGPVHVPGALAPVLCSLAHDHAVYVEPNVWVRHPLP
ncbi:GNAT family N-acetyltransferase [Actinomadura sediminis]|uniref:GNAT family N-acetyltransferase n=1 Tax=Actinomadura sediminis TaxID=1038904 RepID=A0ABW3ER61_9ACTN